MNMSLTFKYAAISMAMSVIHAFAHHPTASALFFIFATYLLREDVERN